jgi:hypothetical protein
MDNDPHADMRSASGSSVQPNISSFEGMPTDMSQSPTFFESNFVIDEPPTPSYDPKLMHNLGVRDGLFFDLHGDASSAAPPMPGGSGGFDDFGGDLPLVEGEPAAHFDIGELVHLDRSY